MAGDAPLSLTVTVSFCALRASTDEREPAEWLGRDPHDVAREIANLTFGQAEAFASQ